MQVEFYLEKYADNNLISEILNLAIDDLVMFVDIWKRMNKIASFYSNYVHCLFL